MNARIVLLWMPLLLSCAAHDAPITPLPLQMSPGDLKTAPGVASITLTGPSSPTCRLIHILDWHLVDRDRFLQSYVGDDLAQAYSHHLDDVEHVQRAQMLLLQNLITEHHLDTVYLESVTPENLSDFEDSIATTLSTRLVCNASRDFVATEPLIDDSSVKETREVLLKTLELSDEILRESYLQHGAAGQLALDGQLCIMPAEDEGAYKAAAPNADGEIDVAANERRESAICRTVLAKDRVAVVILGRDHDLSDNVPKDCEYIRVSVKGLPD